MGGRLRSGSDWGEVALGAIVVVAADGGRWAGLE